MMILVGFELWEFFLFLSGLRLVLSETTRKYLKRINHLTLEDDVGQEGNENVEPVSSFTNKVNSDLLVSQWRLYYFRFIVQAK